MARDSVVVDCALALAALQAEQSQRVSHEKAQEAALALAHTQARDAARVEAKRLAEEESTARQKQMMTEAVARTAAAIHEA
jgi:hypothetical protein